MQANCIDHLNIILDEVHVSGTNLNLEIPESILLQNSTNVRRNLERISDLGVTIGIDNFGTGASAMKYLNEYPITMLKIDNSFIQNISTLKKGNVMIKSLISLAENLKIDLIAEGVETQNQAQILKELGCSNLQGYYYCRPLPSDEFKLFLSQYANYKNSPIIT